MAKGIISLTAPYFYTPRLQTHLVYLPSEQRIYKQKSEMFAVVSAHLSSYYILGMDGRGTFASFNQRQDSFLSSTC
jgi:hypothetical protein